MKAAPKLSEIKEYQDYKDQTVDDACLYKFIQLAAIIGTWEFNLENNTLHWSDVTKEIHEVDLDFVPNVEEGINFYKKGYCRDKITELFTKCITEHESFDIELQIVTAKGKIKWVRAMGYAVLSNGVATSVRGAFQDINDKNKLLKSISLKEEQFRKTFEFAGIGMALVNLKGKWIKVNKSLCNILGYSKKELMSFAYNEITYWDDYAINTHTFENLITGKAKVVEIEKRFIHKKGAVIFTFISVSLVRTDDGKPLHYVYQIKDITKSKRAEEENKRLLEVSEKQNSRLLNFAHIVSHNLRSHYSNLHMLTDILKADEPASTENNVFPLIEQAISHLGETVNHLNQIVILKKEASKNTDTIHLKKLVENSLSGVNALIIDTNVEVNVKINAKMTITGVPAYLDSIFNNLLTNAIKYRVPERPLKIKISAKELDKNVIIKFSDNGSGIDLNLHKDKIFGMYKTFHHHENSRGLGLFITKNQVEAMDGEISVDSTINKGTTFFITLKK